MSKISRVSLAAIWFVALLSPIVSAQSLSTEGVKSLDEYLQQAVAETKIPGIVALVTNKDGVIYERAFGQLDVANNIDVQTDSIFRIASMTKPVTSVAVMMLVEEGKVALDDPISKYLPELSNRYVFTDFNLEDGSYSAQPAKTEMTIRHLLTHTSGLGYSFASPVLAKALGANVSASATGLPLLHEPGTKWSYGESTRVLGLMVEEITGQSLDDFMLERIFKPLAMADTFYEVPKQKNSRVATIHQLNDGKLVEAPNPELITSPDNGDGGLSATAQDYAKFIRLFLNQGKTVNSDQLLNSDTVALMGQNHIGDVRVSEQPAALAFLSKPFPLGAGVDTFGLGFQRTEEQVENMRSPGSLAWAGIFNTEFWIDPEKEIGAVLLMQYLPFYDDDAIEVLQGFETRIYTAIE